MKILYRACDTASNHHGASFAADFAKWPAPGSADTELGVLMEPEVCHGETEVYT